VVHSYWKRNRERTGDFLRLLRLRLLRAKKPAYRNSRCLDRPLGPRVTLVYGGAHAWLGILGNHRVTSRGAVVLNER
jgi:hypothetical protein